MNVDLRRFRYDLEPLHRQAEWKLGAAQAELGRAQTKIEELERSLEVLRQRLHAERERASQGLLRNIDPATHPRTLAWLVRLRQGIQTGEENLRKLKDEREILRARCRELQGKLEVLAQHREESLEEFARQEHARGAAEADRDWLQRTAADLEAVAAGEPS